jgi:hypothetical protein
MWTWEIITGRMFADNGLLEGVGYSGTPAYKNNPQATHLVNNGPIPCGLYKILAPENTEKHGEYVLWLVPDPSNQMFGRSEFGIHGDKIGSPGTASEGCIVLSRGVREAIWESGDHDLQVVATREGIDLEGN